MKDRSYRRFKSFIKAKHKRYLSININSPWYESGKEKYEEYDNLHQYSKNKIYNHRYNKFFNKKTRNKGHRRNKPYNYNSSINYSYKDKKRIISMLDDIKENIYDE